MNSLTVRKVFLPDGQTYEVTGHGQSLAGALVKDGAVVDVSKTTGLGQMLESAVLSNDSRIQTDKDDGGEFIGDPTEVALRILALKGGVSDDRFTKLDDLPFKSENKFRATLTRGKTNRLHVVGAPEVILQKCSRVRVDSEEVEMSSRLSGMINETIGIWSSEALRVVAVAAKYHNADKFEPNDICDLTFLGFAGMIDPPRPEVPHAIEQCRNAGIRVIMLTGDHINTATAIAKNIGMIESHSIDSSVDQSQLETLDDDQFDHVINTAAVFARLTPEMKLRIVNRLRGMDELVAVTGDGVNDAPALKASKCRRRNGNGRHRSCQGVSRRSARR